MEEIWKAVTVDGGLYAERYQVSNLGRVRANPDARISGMKPGRVLFQACDERGYKQVYLYVSQKQKTFKVARLVMTAFVGEREPGMTIDHLNGDKADNTLTNLEYVTRKENTLRSYRTGLRNRQLHRLRNGDWNWAKKLSLEKAREIRARVAAGERRAEVASDYGIHVMTVGEIVRGEIWQELTAEQKAMQQRGNLLVS